MFQISICHLKGSGYIWVSLPTRVARDTSSLGNVSGNESSFVPSCLCSVIISEERNSAQCVYSGVLERTTSV